MIDRGGQLPNKNSVFWTGWPYEDPRMPYIIARNWAREKFSQCGFAMYDAAWTDHDYRRINTADPNDPPNSEGDKLNIQHMFKVFERRSTGTVYVVVPDGQNPNPTSIWSAWEYPTLTRNQRIDKIIRVGWTSRGKCRSGGEETRLRVKRHHRGSDRSNALYRVSHGHMTQVVVGSVVLIA